MALRTWEKVLVLLLLLAVFSASGFAIAQPAEQEVPRHPHEPEKSVQFIAGIFAVPGMSCPPEALHAGDFNGDGCDDLLVRVCEATAVLISNCRDGFEYQTWQGAPDDVRFDRVVTGDFDGDGRCDWTAPAHADGTWTEALSNGSNSFVPHTTQLFTVPEGGLELRAGRFSNPSKDSLFVQSSNPQVWLIAEAEGDGTLRSTGDIELPDSKAALASVADANGDGISDFVFREAAKNGGHRKWWTSAKGRGNRIELAIFPDMSDWDRSLLGDFNGDGRLDVLAYGGKLSGWWLVAAPSQGTAAVLAGIPSSHWEEELTAADVNGDGLDDILSYDKDHQAFTVLHSHPGNNPPPPQSDDEAAPEGHHPAVCLGYTGAAPENWSRLEKSCPPGHSYMEIKNSAGWRWQAEEVSALGTCCPLPSGDILSKEKIFAPVECPPDSVATGSDRGTGCRYCTKLLECTKINTQRYRLGPPKEGVYWGPRYGRRITFPRLSQASLPAAVRFGFGRMGFARWDLTGCTGSPVGSLLVRKGPKDCSGFRFRELQYSGQKGDPPAGTPVVMFPKCRRLDTIFSPDAACLQ